MAKYLKPKLSGDPNVDILPVVPMALKATFPALGEFLTETKYPDGKSRETSTITVFVQDGMVKVCLNDRDQGRVLFRAGEDVVTALQALEDALTGDDADWRAAAGKGRRR